MEVDKWAERRNDGVTFRKAIKGIPLIAIGIMAVILGAVIHKSGTALSVETVLDYTPKTPFLAALVLLLFFALKSLTVVLPLAVLYLAGGVLFPPAIAVFMSMAGVLVTISIPYWIGRYSGEEMITAICSRYPKAGQIAAYQQKNCFFACFITRIVGFLPGDIISLYFGACEVKFSVYLLAGLCGSMLSIVTTTLLGSKLSDPYSMEFLIVLLCRIMVSGGAIVLQYRLNLKRKQTETKNN